MIDELKAVVREHEKSRPRSMQVAIGPSEAGTPCSRRLAYRLLGVEPSNSGGDPWAAIVGTSVHAWLADAFAGDNARSGDERQRWHTEVSVDLPGYMRGSVDLYDAKAGRVIDHKVLGATSLKKFRTDGPSVQYRTQVHLYACGLSIAGANVKEVAIAAWSRSGGLKDAVWWSEPYDEQIAEDCLRRLDALRSTTELLGVAALPLIPTADAFCSFCPFYLPGVTDVEDACGGHVAGPNPNPTPQKVDAHA
jgi:hypothetical protein